MIVCTYLSNFDFSSCIIYFIGSQMIFTCHPYMFNLSFHLFLFDFFFRKCRFLVLIIAYIIKISFVLLCWLHSFLILLFCIQSLLKIFFLLYYSLHHISSILLLFWVLLYLCHEFSLHFILCILIRTYCLFLFSLSYILVGTSNTVFLYFTYLSSM